MFKKNYKNIFKILLTCLPMELQCRYISESWKRITANATIIDGVIDRIILSVYSKVLEKNYCKYH
jgi:hypothetical protein